MKNLICLVWILLIFNLVVEAQKNPVFSSFVGDLYDLQDMKMGGVFDDYVFDCIKLNKVVWSDLDIPKTTTKENFPGTEQQFMVGALFNSKMTIAEDGFYEFVLESDDGSYLWIDDVLVLDNGGSHGMLENRDTIRLLKGVYPIKIWYFQAYAYYFGLKFTANNLGDNINSKPLGGNRFTLVSDILFNTNEHEIRYEATFRLDSICREIKLSQPQKLIIKGHTDNVGSDRFNLSLSKKRAKSLEQYLKSKLEGLNIDYVTLGLGESEPVFSNETDFGRRKNRRVELEMHY